jgi:hypothetical protein
MRPRKRTLRYTERRIEIWSAAATVARVADIFTTSSTTSTAPT